MIDSKMIEAHGGMVWVESPASCLTERPGSAFFLLIPLEDGTEGPRQTVFPFMRAEPALVAHGRCDSEHG